MMEKSKKKFLANTKFIVEGLISSNYDLEENNYKLQQERDTYKKQLDEVKECVKNSYDRSNCETVLQIIESEDDNEKN